MSSGITRFDVTCSWKRAGCTFAIPFLARTSDHRDTIKNCVSRTVAWLPRDIQYIWLHGRLNKRWEAWISSWQVLTCDVTHATFLEYRSFIVANPLVLYIRINVQLTTDILRPILSNNDDFYDLFALWRGTTTLFVNMTRGDNNYEMKRCTSQLSRRQISKIFLHFLDDWHENDRGESIVRSIALHK